MKPTPEDWLERGIDPPAVRTVEGFFCTSGIPGADLTTGHLPAEPAEQFALAFENLRSLLGEQKLGVESIGLLNVYIRSREARPFIDPPWEAMFPDPERRPARKTNEVRLPGAVQVQVQAFGRAGETCRSVEIPGLRHRAPLPMGAMVGSTVFSSVIGGDDPATGGLISETAAQIDQAFRNAALLMEQAGGTADGINHMWAFMGDMGDASTMLDTYLAMFADPSNRPARKTVPYALPGGLSIQLQITGDTGGRTGNFEVRGVGHHDPIPLASRAGHLLQSSGIYGIDPSTSGMVEGGLEEQTRASLDHIESVMAEAGGTLESIAGITVLVRGFGDMPWLARAVEERFPAGSLPALRFIAYPLPEELFVQFHLTGWI